MLANTFIYANYNYRRDINFAKFELYKMKNMFFLM